MQVISHDINMAQLLNPEPIPTQATNIKDPPRLHLPGGICLTPVFLQDLGGINRIQTVGDIPESFRASNKKFSLSLPLALQASDENRPEDAFEHDPIVLQRVNQAQQLGNHIV